MIKITEFKTIKIITIDLGFGRFIEVSHKESPQGNSFIAITKGEHWYDGKNPKKRYNKSITIPCKNEIVLKVIDAIKEVQYEENTTFETIETEIPTEEMIDKG